MIIRWHLVGRVSLGGRGDHEPDRSPEHWSVHEGQGAGSATEVVGEFRLLDGGGGRMPPTGNETKATRVPCGSVDFQEAVAAVKAALEEDHLGE